MTEGVPTGLRRLFLLVGAVVGFGLIAVVMAGEAHAETGSTSRPPPGNGLLSGVGTILGGVVGPVARPVVAPVVEPVAEILAPVTAPLEPVLVPVLEPLRPVVEPVARSLGATPVIDAVAPAPTAPAARVPAARVPAGGPPGGGAPVTSEPVDNTPVAGEWADVSAERPSDIAPVGEPAPVVAELLATPAAVHVPWTVDQQPVVLEADTTPITVPVRPYGPDAPSSPDLPAVAGTSSTTSAGGGGASGAAVGDLPGDVRTAVDSRGRVVNAAHHDPAAWCYVFGRSHPS
ncbi:hypothetical protein [Actinosynnema sp. NPDC023587]|uniref:hypothetical protein n=1 Tax=Actinosynnema sp. NPDC023587 TaxID=3154695 RepID=UPI003400CBDA